MYVGIGCSCDVEETVWCGFLFAFQVLGNYQIDFD